MQRRDFILGCAAGLGCSTDALAQSPSGTARPYRRALLVDARGEGLLAREIAPRQNLLFHYPYVGTPAFLLNLGRPTATSSALSTAKRSRYQWRGGVGAARSIVAFSAICAHQMAYPTRDISFISFREQAGPQHRRAEVIHCCAEHSQYDPADGARVVAGPATQPLAAIVLEHDAATDTLHAVATQGGELFDAFFAKYEVRLSLEYGARARDRVGETCTVVPMDQYCRQQVRC